MDVACCVLVVVSRLLFRVRCLLCLGFVLMCVFQLFDDCRVLFCCLLDCCWLLAVGCLRSVVCLLLFEV